MQTSLGATPFEPRRPTLAALGLLSVWVAILAVPMLSGQWLAAPGGDQYASGYALRAFGAEQWRATGHVPLWNPMIFGGLPYVASVGHGDVFYPTSFLRLVLPVEVVMNLGFVLHYILAGLFVYLLLRRFNLSWTGAVVGGVAYQLSGLLISYPNPGHDGKLFVSALLPLALLALVLAIRERRWAGYPLLSLTVGLSLLSPHFQMTYYLLIASGLFALYTALGEPTDEPLRPRVGRLAMALAAVVLGFGIAAPQILPFLAYLPHSPRAEGYYGFAGATSYAIPWDHVPEFFLAGFTGAGETYWGSNPLKLHSEYLGLGVVALAILGAGDSRRRLIRWLGGIGLLFLLVSLGASTPFYRVWWAVMPYVQKTRAPGMAFYVVALVAAIYAGLGAARLEQGQGRSHVKAWLIAAGAVALLALAGAWSNFAVSLARANPEAASGSAVAAAMALKPAIALSALLGAVALAAVAALAFGAQRGRVPALAFAIGLPLVVGADLWRDGRHFWSYQPPPRQGTGLYAQDELVARLRQDPPPYRVLNAGVYPLNVLAAHHVPQALGYFSFEIRYYDELLDRHNQWRNLGSPKYWNLLAVKYLILSDSAGIPGYHRVLGPVRTATGGPGYLYQADSVPPYARVVPGAVTAESGEVLAALTDPRLDLNRLVLFDPTQAVTPARLSDMPPPSPSHARVTSWAPGRMAITLEPAPPLDSYVLVSENWYLDWQVTVDGRPGQVLRGDHALITVPVSAGAKTLELSIRSRSYERGRTLSLISLLVVLGAAVGPAAARWRRRG